MSAARHFTKGAKLNVTTPNLLPLSITYWEYTRGILSLSGLSICRAQKPLSSADWLISPSFEVQRLVAFMERLLLYRSALRSLKKVRVSAAVAEIRRTFSPHMPPHMFISTPKSFCENCSEKFHFNLTPWINRNKNNNNHLHVHWNGSWKREINSKSHTFCY